MKIHKLTFLLYLLMPLLAWGQVTPPGGGGGGGGGVITDVQDGAGDSTMNATLNAMQVSCVSGCGGSGGSSQADDAAFLVGVNDVNPVGYMFDDVAPDAVNEGDAGIPRMSSNRVPYGIIRDASGQERGANVNASNELLVAVSSIPSHAVTNAGTFAVQAAQTGTWNIGTVTAVTGITNALPAGTNVIGHVIVDTSSTTAVTQATGSNLHMVVDSGTITAVTSITNALPAGTNAIGKLAANSGVDIGDVDVTSVIPGTGATNLGKAEDAAHTTGDIGVLSLAVRNDAGTVLCGTTGDYCPVTTDSSGAIRVTGGGGGTQYNEDDATPATIVGTAILMERDDALSTVTPLEADWIGLRGTSIGSLWVRDDNGNTVDSIAGATDRGMPVLVIRDDSLSTLTPADGDYTNLRVNSTGSLHVMIDSIAATASSLTETDDGSIATGQAGITVTTAILYCFNGTANEVCEYTNGSGLDTNIKAIVPGTGATNLGKAVDSASGATDTGIAMLAIRDDALSALTPVEGDYVHLRVSSTGALHVTGGGGGTQYNIGDVASATATGTVTLAIRDDALSTLADAEGDVVGLRVNSQGALHVTGGGGGTEYVVNDIAPADPTGATFTMERDDALSTLTEIEGDWTNPRATAEGALWTQDFNSDDMLTKLTTIAGAVAGTEMQVDVLTVPADPFGANADAASASGSISAKLRQIATNGHPVTNAGTFVTQIDGTALTHLSSIASNTGTLIGAVHVEDEALAPGAGGILGLVLRQDTPANTSGANGDLEVLQMSAGRLWVDASGKDLSIGTIAAGDNNIGNVDIVTLPNVTVGVFPDNEPFNVAQIGGTATVTAGVAGLLAVGGNIAHDTADAGNPVKVGGKSIAFGANPTAVTAADRSDLYMNRHGIPFMLGGHMNSISISSLIADSDNAQTNAALVTIAGGLKIVVTRLTASCDGSTTAPTNIRIGFGATAVPTAALAGAAGILHEFQGVPPGGGFTIGDGGGILGVGADGEDLRFSTEDPAGGSCTISATYFTIES